MSTQEPQSLDWGLGHYESTAAQLEPAAVVVVDRARLQPGDRVLDLGCGTGNASLLAAAAGAAVTGVDPAGRLLDVARSRVAAAGLTAAFESGHAAAVPLPNGSVDVIVSVFGVIFAPDPIAAAAEMDRVLAAGGRILLSAWRPEGAIHDINRLDSRMTMEALELPPPPAGFAWHEPEALTSVFGPLGFEVTAEEHTLAFRSRSVEEYIDTEHRNHPMAVRGRAMVEGRGRGEAVAERLRAGMVEILTTANEDPAAFQVTSRFVVAIMRRSPA